MKKIQSKMLLAIMLNVCLIHSSQETNPGKEQTDLHSTKKPAQTSTAWSTTAQVTAGVVGVAAVAGAVHLYDPTAFTQLAEKTTNLVQWLAGNSTKSDTVPIPTIEDSKEINTEFIHKEIEEQAAKIAQLEAERIEAERVAAEIKKAHLAELSRLEAIRIEQEHLAQIAQVEIEKKLQAEMQLRLEQEQRNNTLLGVGLATGAAGIVGLSMMHNKAETAERTAAQLKKDKDALLAQLQSSPLARSKEQFEYFNYVDTAANQLDSQALHGASLVEKKQSERITRATNLKDSRTEIERKSSIPLIETEHVNLVCGGDNFPTLDAIKELMRKQYFPHIALQALSVDLVNIGGGNGMMSDKVYSVAVHNDPIFFLKISKAIRTGTHKRLEAIQTSRIGRIGIESRYADTKLLIPKKNLPRLIWVEKFFTYTNPQGQSQIIEVTHAAQGKSLGYILALEEESLQTQAMHATGKALGNFHQAFMHYNNSDDAQQWTTVSHGDFHPGNIFFDAKNSQVYFIDNEAMSDNSNLMADLYRFLFFTLLGYQNLMNSYIQNSTKPGNHASNTAIISNMITVINAYMESFSESRKNSLEMPFVLCIQRLYAQLAQREPQITFLLIEALNNKIFKHYICSINNITHSLDVLPRITENSDGTRIERTLNNDGTISAIFLDTLNKKTKIAILKDLKLTKVTFFNPNEMVIKVAEINPNGSELHTDYLHDGVTIEKFVAIDNPTLPQTQVSYQAHAGKKGAKINEILLHTDGSKIITVFNPITGQIITSTRIDSQGKIIL